MKNAEELQPMDQNPSKENSCSPVMHNVSDMFESVRKNELDELLREVLSDNARIPLLFEIIRTDQGSMKFTCEKVIRLVSEQKPELIYPYFDNLVQMLDSHNNFIAWGASLTIANLIGIDRRRKFDRIYDRYFAGILSDSMITAGNIIKNAWRFVLANPQWESDITARLLSVADHTYLHKGEPSPECGKIVRGGVLECFDKYYDLSSGKPEMIQFAAELRNCSRKPVAKKAAAFMKKHGA